MRAKFVGLLNDVVATYDKTKTTRAGRVSLKTLPAPYDTTQVLGPPLSKFIDVQNDTAPVSAVLPGYMHYTASGRLFVLQGAVLALGTTNNVLLYNFNEMTGAHTYVGRIQFAMSGTGAIVVRGFKVDDTNTSNIKIVIGYTIATVTTGGAVVINKVALSDFAPAGFTTFYTAQTNDAKAVYHLQAPLETGGANPITTCAGLSMPNGSADASINTKLFVHNGIAATHQMHIFDLAVAPTIASMGGTTVTAGNTTGASTTFTMTGNTLKVNDTVIFTSNAPTGYTNTAPTAVQTIYYVVATNFVAGSTFSLSATLGGAIVAASSVSTTATLMRALGASDSMFFARTGNLTALAGTLLLTNSENWCVPSSGANSGQDCVFMSTTTNYYLGRFTQLFSSQTGTTSSGFPTITGLTSTASLNAGQTVFGTGIPSGATILSIDSPTAITISANATASGSTTIRFGATLWPSLDTVNVLGNTVDYVIPVPVQAGFATSINRVIAPVSASLTLVKAFVNNVIEGNYGSTGNTIMEAQNHVTDVLGILALNAFENGDGWVFYSSSATIGQRGIVCMDLRSDSHYEYSYVVSPLVFTGGQQTLVNIRTIRTLLDITGPVVLQYRTAATSSDPIFNTATGSWNTIVVGTELAIDLESYTQFRILYRVIANPGEGAVPVTTPAQVVDIIYTVALLGESSDMWDYSYADSSSAIPTRIGFNLRAAYATGVVPGLQFEARDAAGALVALFDTVNDPAYFEYSTNAGLSWNPLGTIPNVAGTRVRFTFTTPPGVDIRVSIREL